MIQWEVREFQAGLIPPGWEPFAHSDTVYFWCKRIKEPNNQDEALSPEK